MPSTESLCNVIDLLLPAVDHIDHRAYRKTIAGNPNAVGWGRRLVMDRASITSPVLWNINAFAQWQISARRLSSSPQSSDRPEAIRTFLDQFASIAGDCFGSMESREWGLKGWQNSLQATTCRTRDGPETG